MNGSCSAGRPFECDFGFSGMNGVCVPYVEKNKADLASPPPPPPPVAPAPPPPTPAAQSNLLEDNIGLESRGCADPIVQGLIALDNEARAAIGSPQLTCDENVCRLALEHSKSQCLYAPSWHPSWPTLHTIMCNECHQVLLLALPPHPLIAQSL